MQKLTIRGAHHEVNGQASVGLRADPQEWNDEIADVDTGDVDNDFHRELGVFIHDPTALADHGVACEQAEIRAALVLVESRGEDGDGPVARHRQVGLVVGLEHRQTQHVRGDHRRVATALRVGRHTAAAEHDQYPRRYHSDAESIPH